MEPKWSSVDIFINVRSRLHVIGKVEIRIIYQKA